MNERIKELAKQAQKVIWPADGEITELTDLDVEKFAKLIVLDCIGIMELRSEDGVAYVPDVITRLEKHFGVE